MTSSDLLIFTSLLLMAVGLIVLAEWVVVRGYIEMRTSRRTTHLVVGLFVVIALVLVESPLWLYASAVAGLVVTVVSRQKDWIVAIHSRRDAIH